MLSQAGSSQASLVDSTPSLARSALSQAGSSQASLADSTPASSALSQAGSSQAGSYQTGSSQAFPGDSTLSESALSQGGNSQASLEENTLSPAESELSQGSFPSFPEDSTLQAERPIPAQTVRCSARLRARQAGNSSREVSKVSQ